MNLWKILKVIELSIIIILNYFLTSVVENEVEMKIITICGSLRFEPEIKYHTERLTLEGNCVLPLIYPTKDKVFYTSEQREQLAASHKKKIDLADAIFVVNKNGYIGESVRVEIEHAKASGKEILYLENVD